MMLEFFRSAAFVITITLVIGCKAQEPWLDQPYIHTYQGSDVISERMGSREKFDAVVDSFVSRFKDKANSISPITDDKVQLVILFNEKGEQAVWFIGETESNRKKLRSILNNVSMQDFKTLTGSLGVAVALRRMGVPANMAVKPPIPAEWDPLINENKKIPAGELFSLLLKQAAGNED